MSWSPRSPGDCKVCLQMEASAYKDVATPFYDKLCAKPTAGRWTNYNDATLSKTDHDGVRWLRVEGAWKVARYDLDANKIYKIAGKIYGEGKLKADEEVIIESTSSVVSEFEYIAVNKTVIQCVATGASCDFHIVDVQSVGVSKMFDYGTIEGDLEPVSSQKAYRLSSDECARTVEDGTLYKSAKGASEYAFLMQASWSLAAVIRLNDFPNAERKFASTKGLDTSGKSYFEIGIDEDWHLFIKITNSGVLIVDWTSTEYIHYSKIHIVQAVYSNGTGMVVYLDGVLVGTIPVSTSLAAGTQSDALQVLGDVDGTCAVDLFYLSLYSKALVTADVTRIKTWLEKYVDDVEIPTSPLKFPGLLAWNKAENKYITRQSLSLLDLDMETSGTANWTASASLTSKAKVAGYEGNCLRIELGTTKAWVYQASPPANTTWTKVTGKAKPDGNGVLPWIMREGNAGCWTGTSVAEWQDIDVSILNNQSEFLQLGGKGAGLASNYVYFDSLEVTSEMITTWASVYGDKSLVKLASFGSSGGRYKKLQGIDVVDIAEAIRYQTASDFKCMHDGTGMTYFLAIITETLSSSRWIFSSLDQDLSSNPGISLYCNATNKLVITIKNDTGTTVCTGTEATASTSNNSKHLIVVQTFLSGGVVCAKVWVDKVLVINATGTGAPGTTNPPNGLHLGYEQKDTYVGGIELGIAEQCMFTSKLSDESITELSDYFYDVLGK